MRPIDADRLIQNNIEDMHINTDFMTAAVLSAFNRMLMHEPTIEAEPVRHGEWLDSGINGTVSCSLCMFTDFFANQNRVMLFKYCPGCGAKMDGGIPDETVHDKK